MEEATSRQRHAAAAAGLQPPRGGGGGAGQQNSTQVLPLPVLPYALATAPYSLYQHPATLYGFPPSFPLQPYPLGAPVMHPWHPSLLPLPPFPLPTYPHLTHCTSTQHPAVHITPVQEETTEDLTLPWLQKLNQSDHALCDGVMGDVCGEIVESALPDMVREVINATVNDIICSYIGHRWARGPQPHTAIMKPHPPSQPQPIRLPHSLLPVLPRSEGAGMALSLTTDSRYPILTIPEECKDQLLLCKDKPELCHLVCTVLMEQLLFSALLTFDLDGGVSMATRTQSTHIFTAMLFDELLTRLITH